MFPDSANGLKSRAVSREWNRAACGSRSTIRPHDPKVFLLVERWESAEALDVHRTAKAYTEIYKPNVLPRVTRSPHPSQLVE